MGNKSKLLKYLFTILFIIFLFRAFIADRYHIPSGSMIPTIMPGDKIIANKFIWGLSVPWKNLKLIDWGEAKKGDLIIFEPSGNKDIKFKSVSSTKHNSIKRMIANEGDSFEINNNIIYINGKAIKRKKIKEKFFIKARENIKAYTATLYEESLGSYSYQTITINRYLDYFGADKDGNYTTEAKKIVKPYIVPKDSYFLLSDYRDLSFFDSRAFGPVKKSDIYEEDIVVGELVESYELDSSKVKIPDTLPPLRVVASSNDSIEIKNQIVYINGKAIKRVLDKTENKVQYSNNNIIAVNVYKETIAELDFYIYWTVSETANFGVDKNGNTSFYRIDIPELNINKIVAPYKVPKDYCFGLGDNRDASLDSRFLGPIPKDNIKGTPFGFSTNNKSSKELHGK